MGGGVVPGARVTQGFQYEVQFFFGFAEQKEKPSKYYVDVVVGGGGTAVVVYSTSRATFKCFFSP